MVRLRCADVVELVELNHEVESTTSELSDDSVPTLFIKGALQLRTNTTHRSNTGRRLDAILSCNGSGEKT